MARFATYTVATYTGAEVARGQIYPILTCPRDSDPVPNVEQDLEVSGRTKRISWTSPS